MRFAIAAGILAHTLPAASEMENSVLLSQAERRLQIQDLLQEPPSSGRDTVKKTYKKGDGGSLFSSFGIQGRREGILKNKMKSVVECDPTASNADADADADADLGVLSCGMGQYCMESKNSELGGACVDLGVEVDRELQEDDDEYDGLDYGYGILCNTTYAAIFNFTDCDCGEFDTTTGIGTIECIYVDTCFSDIGCNSTCATIDFGVVVYPDGNFSTNYCYNFYSPYEQQVCFTGYGADEVDEDASCSLSFNGVECDSCFFSYYSNETSISKGNSTYNVTKSGYCQEFDCTNTAGGHSGNTCEDGDLSIAPIIRVCLDPNATYLPTLPPVPETPAPTLTPVPVVSPTPSMAPSTEETTAPTLESGIPGILSTKGVMSLFGLSMAMVAYFAG